MDADGSGASFANSSTISSSAGHTNGTQNFSAMDVDNSRELDFLEFVVGMWSLVATMRRPSLVSASIFTTRTAAGSSTTTSWSSSS